jgi:hypothetical protein
MLGRHGGTPTQGKALTTNFSTLETTNSGTDTSHIPDTTASAYHSPYAAAPDHQFPNPIALSELFNIVGPQTAHPKPRSISSQMSYYSDDDSVLFGKAIDFVMPEIAKVKGIPCKQHEDFRDELLSMKKLAKLVKKDTLNFMKPICRGRWQELAKKERNEIMRRNPKIKGVKADHKNKTMADKLFKPMGEYFSKHRITDLGAYVYWWGMKTGQEGWYMWFFDFVIENTTSQEPRDLLPGLEALLEEFNKESFMAIAGETEEIWLANKSALSSLEVTAYLDMPKRCNKQLLKITCWNHPEAQRLKKLIDTHICYLNVWIAKQS